MSMGKREQIRIAVVCAAAPRRMIVNRRRCPAIAQLRRLIEILPAVPFHAAEREAEPVHRRCREAVFARDARLPDRAVVLLHDRAMLHVRERRVDIDDRGAGDHPFDRDAIVPLA